MLGNSFVYYLPVTSPVSILEIKTAL